MTNTSSKLSHALENSFFFAKIQSEKCTSRHFSPVRACEKFTHNVNKIKQALFVNSLKSCKLKKLGMKTDAKLI